MIPACWEGTDPSPLVELFRGGMPKAINYVEHIYFIYIYI
jgi:hypothetical protein